MIAVKDLQRITTAYPYADRIPIDGNDYIERIGDMAYQLHTADAILTVTGISWGHGTLFVMTKERGNLGIQYAHEINPDDCDYETEDGDVCEPAPRWHQCTILDYLGVGQ